MNITHVMSRFRLSEGGVVRAVLDLTAMLARRGHRVRVVTWDASDVPSAWKRGQEGAPEVVEVAPPAGRFGFLRRDQFGTLESVLRDSEVLHLHTPWEPVNLQMAAAARRLNRPYVLTPHGMLDDWSMRQKGSKKRLFLALGGRRLLNGAAVIHCTAGAELDQAKRWFPAERGIVAPLVFDLEPFRELPGAGPAERRWPPIAANEPMVLFLSRLHPKKSPEIVLEAASRLHDHGVACLTVLAGSGEAPYERQLRERAAAMDLGDRVIFLGHVGGVEKVSLFQRADVFALPTQQENFGFVFIESLACGTPVVTTRGVDIWPELESSGGAAIVERTAAAFADAIEALLRDARRRTEMGRRGREWVQREFDEAALATRYEALYLRAMES